MYYSIATTVQPVIEPITLDQAKLHLRVDHAVDDALITSLIAMSRGWCEQYTERAFINQTKSMTLSIFPRFGWFRDGIAHTLLPVSYRGAIRLPFGPVSSITSVQYVDGAGVTQTMISPAYQVWLEHEPPLVAPASQTGWPATEVDTLKAVTVAYVCGYGATATSVPDAIRQAILLMVGQHYERRGDGDLMGNLEVIGIHPAVKLLLSPYRTSIHS